jgi:2-keto-4-pentenoate hydratase/2-oxohepta-3-ene-1,7-dioic acid hydratase in catechol pathway
MTRHTIAPLLAVVLVAFTAFASGCSCPQKPSSANPASEEKPTRFARFIGDSGQPVYGVVEHDNVREITSAPWENWKKTGRRRAISRTRFLAVTDARNCYAMAGNYKSHLAGATTQRMAQTRIPQFFMKSTSCLTGHGDDIVLPPGSAPVHYEGELVVVIGKAGRNIPKGKALEHVLGVAAGNDVSARDWQTGDIQWWRAKGSDTFGPTGPFILTGVDYGKLNLTLRQNGALKMSTNSDQLLHDIPASIEFLSKHITLQPGDLIFTGTAGQTEEIKAGDVIEVELEGAGVLRNKVVEGR